MALEGVRQSNFLLLFSANGARLYSSGSHELMLQVWWAGAGRKLIKPHWILDSGRNDAIRPHL
jgi:hypothetical protein